MENTPTDGSVTLSVALHGTLELWYVTLMRVRPAIARAFAWAAVLGMLLAPVARPAMAMPADEHVMMGKRAATAPAVAIAPADMPCCPDMSSFPDCGKECPLMALCAATLLCGATQTSLTAPLASIAVALPGDPAPLASLVHAPPRKPPKS